MKKPQIPENIHVSRIPQFFIVAVAGLLIAAYNGYIDLRPQQNTPVVIIRQGSVAGKALFKRRPPQPPCKKPVAVVVVPGRPKQYICPTATAIPVVLPRATAIPVVLPTATLMPLELPRLPDKPTATPAP